MKSSRPHLAWATAVLPLLLAACGGGSQEGPSATTQAAVGTSRARAQSIAKTVKVLPVASTTITRTEPLDKSDDFEAAQLSWGDNCCWPDPTIHNIAYGIETNPANVHSGNQSARFRIDEPSNAIFLHNSDWVFSANQRYKFGVWMKADAPTSVDLMLRADGSNYFRQYATRHVSLTAAWQQFFFEGIPAEPNTQFVIVPAKGVTVYVDDVTVAKVIQDELKPFNSTATIPDTLFGMHMNQMGTVANWPKTWPKLGQRILRLHDTGTHWANLQPDTLNGAPNPNHNWDFGRLDMFVSLAKGDGPAGTFENFPQFGIKAPTPSAELLYEMGMTPTWASSKPTASGKYGAGSTFPPSNLQDWTNYVTRIGTRYKGRIKYWEVWNEWDIGGGYNYDGDVATMVAMTKIAHDVLKQIDPNNVIVAPSVTVGGMPLLDAFLQAGGAQYVDVIAYHAGGGQTDPASTYWSIANVRAVMASNKVSLPLWDTEAGISCDPNITQNCNLADTTLAANVSTTVLGWPLRHMITLWDQGVSNFNYYFYEGAGNGSSALVYGLYEHGTQALCGTGWDSTFPDLNPNCQTPLGKAYTRAVGFLKGAVLTDAYETAGNSGRIFVFKLSVAGKLRVIAWTTGADEAVRLPSNTAWNTLKNVNTVTGGKSSIPYDFVQGTLTISRYVTLSGAPVVLTVD